MRVELDFYLPACYNFSSSQDKTHDYANIYLARIIIFSFNNIF